MNRDILKKKIRDARNQRNEANVPDIKTIVENVGKSVVRNIKSVAAGHHLYVSDEEKSRRLSICKNCEFFDVGQNRCNKCGCYLAFKTWLKAEKCPIDNW